VTLNEALAAKGRGLIAHPAVLLVAVVGAPDPIRGEIVKAFIVPRPGISAEPTGEIQAFVRDRLAVDELDNTRILVGGLAAGRGRKATAAWRSPVRGLSASTVDSTSRPLLSSRRRERVRAGKARRAWPREAPPARQHVSTDIAKPVT
jgi:acyl-CoA synthetase (AMP-forming)/AMP-acid ligase II